MPNVVSKTGVLPARNRLPTLGGPSELDSESRWAAEQREQLPPQVMQFLGDLAEHFQRTGDFSLEELGGDSPTIQDAISALRTYAEEQIDTLASPDSAIDRRLSAITKLNEALFAAFVLDTATGGNFQVPDGSEWMGFNQLQESVLQGILLDQLKRQIEKAPVGDEILEVLDILRDYATVGKYPDVLGHLSLSGAWGLVKKASAIDSKLSPDSPPVLKDLVRASVGRMALVFEVPRSAGSALDPDLQETYSKLISRARAQVLAKVPLSDSTVYLKFLGALRGDRVGVLRELGNALIDEYAIKLSRQGEEGLAPQAYLPEARSLFIDNARQLLEKMTRMLRGAESAEGELEQMGAEQLRSMLDLLFVSTRFPELLPQSVQVLRNIQEYINKIEADSGADQIEEVMRLKEEIPAILILLIDEHRSESFRAKTPLLTGEEKGQLMGMIAQLSTYQLRRFREGLQLLVEQNVVFGLPQAGAINSEQEGRAYDFGSVLLEAMASRYLASNGDMDDEAAVLSLGLRLASGDVLEGVLFAKQSVVVDAINRIVEEYLDRKDTQNLGAILRLLKAQSEEAGDLYRYLSFSLRQEVLAFISSQDFSSLNNELIRSLVRSMLADIAEQREEGKSFEVRDLVKMVKIVLKNDRALSAFAEHKGAMQLVDHVFTGFGDLDASLKAEWLTIYAKLLAKLPDLNLKWNGLKAQYTQLQRKYLELLLRYPEQVEATFSLLSQKQLDQLGLVVLRSVDDLLQSGESSIIEQGLDKASEALQKIWVGIVDAIAEKYRKNPIGEWSIVRGIRRIYFRMLISNPDVAQSLIRALVYSDGIRGAIARDDFGNKSLYSGSISLREVLTTWVVHRFNLAGSEKEKKNIVGGWVQLVSKIWQDLKVEEIRRFIKLRGPQLLAHPYFAMLEVLLALNPLLSGRGGNIDTKAEEWKVFENQIDQLYPTFFAMVFFGRDPNRQQEKNLPKKVQELLKRARKEVRHLRITAFFDKLRGFAPGGLLESSPRSLESIFSKRLGKNFSTRLVPALLSLLLWFRRAG